VLGAGLHGDGVSPVLAERLNEAIAYTVKYPGTPIVVSGGVGDGKNISEAYAMEQYLIKNGVTSVILLEEQSTNTEENLLYSKAILDEYFAGEDYKIGISTNMFHSYRARLNATNIGLEAYSLITETSNVFALPASYIRESFALTNYWLSQLKAIN